MMTQEQFKKAAQYKQAGFGVVNDEHILKETHTIL